MCRAGLSSVEFGGSLWNWTFCLALFPTVALDLHGIRTVKQWSRWARHCVGSIHGGFQTRPYIALNSLVWSQNWCCFEQKFALETSWGLFQPFIILWSYISGGNPHKLDISRISSYSFTGTIQMSSPLTFSLLWYQTSSKRWLDLWV